LERRREEEKGKEGMRKGEKVEGGTRSKGANII